VDKMIITPRIEQLHAKLVKIQEGDLDIDPKKPKNAFLHPGVDGSEFPQHAVVKPIDFRAQNLPMAGYAFRGNRRKYDAEQAAYMDNLKKKHPHMEILAGGGGTQRADIGLIKDRMSKPAAMEDVSNEVDAGPPMIEFKAAPEFEIQDSDHTRIPLLKDVMRDKRLAAQRPRARARTKAKGKK